MAQAPHLRGVLPASDRLDVLALAPLPCRSNGRVAFQLGGSLYCVWLLEALANLGHRVRALAVSPTRSDALQPGELGAGVSVDWFAVEPLDTLQPPHAGDVRKRRTQFEAALDGALTAGRPDIVILGNEHHAWYAADVCRERGLPIVLVSHGVPTAALPTGIYPRPALRALVDHLAKVDLIVTVAQHLEETLRGLGLTRIRTIRTGIDTDLFSPRRGDPALLEVHGIDPDRLVVGFFAHIRSEKRLADLVASASIVLRTEPRFLYLVVGDGPCRQAAAELVAEKGLGDSVRFVGELDHSDVSAHMALCDVVALTSEREGCPLVCLEAQASGLALIAPGIPAGRELVDDGGTGLLFRLGDVADLAEKTLALARDEALRRSLGRNARAAALTNTAEHWARAWSDELATTARGGVTR